MTEHYAKLLSDARNYVTDLFLNKVNKTIKFHNLDHTQAVVMACEEMANYYNLNDEDRLIVLLAAWFHDTGFSSGDAHDHEDVSISLATNFLNEQNTGAYIHQKVTSCIEATKMPQAPSNLLEQILCDVGVAVAVGIGLTVTVAVIAEPAQPPAVGVIV